MREINHDTLYGSGRLVSEQETELRDERRSRADLRPNSDRSDRPEKYPKRDADLGPAPTEPKRRKGSDGDSPRDSIISTSSSIPSAQEASAVAAAHMRQFMLNAITQMNQ